MEHTYNYPTMRINRTSTSSASSSSSITSNDITKTPPFVKTHVKCHSLTSLFIPPPMFPISQDITVETKGRFTVTTSQSSFYRPRALGKEGRFIKDDLGSI
jgi:hypothetical protein